MQVYKQKIKHLLYEHQNNVEALKIQQEEKVKEAIQSCKAKQDALIEDKVRLREQLRVQVQVLYVLCTSLLLIDETS